MCIQTGREQQQWGDQRLLAMTGDKKTKTKYLLSGDKNKVSTLL